MLGIAAAFRRLNRWRVNCGGIFTWGGRAISPYYGFAAGWVVILAYVVGVVSISLPIGPYVVSLFTSANSRPGEAIVGFIAVILATVVAYIGIRLTAWTQWILIAIGYIGIGILAIWCLVSVFSHNSHSVPFSWSWFSWHSMGGVSGFVAASLIAVYLYSGWSGSDLVSLYVMLGIGAVIALYVRFWGHSDYFSRPRETYQPEGELVAAQSDLVNGNPESDSRYD
jgi:amino acid transporter